MTCHKPGTLVMFHIIRRIINGKLSPGCPGFIRKLSPYKKVFSVWLKMSSVIADWRLSVRFWIVSRLQLSYCFAVITPERLACVLMTKGRDCSGSSYFSGPGELGEPGEPGEDWGSDSSKCSLLELQSKVEMVGNRKQADLPTDLLSGLCSS